MCVTKETDYSVGEGAIKRFASFMRGNYPTLPRVDQIDVVERAVYEIARVVQDFILKKISCSTYTVMFP